MKDGIIVLSEGELRRKNNTICFITEDEKRFVPVENVREIYVLNEISFNKKFLELLYRHKIIMHFFNHFGSYIGTFYPKEFLNSGYLILKQAEHYLDPFKRLEIAKQVVFGAIENMRRVLSYYDNRGKPLATYITKIGVFEDSIWQAESIEELMALEGNAKNIYYEAFDSITGNEDFCFQQRTRRPPRNRLNALLSFGYSLLYATCLTEIYYTHLDPRIGYLHATNFRKFSLNLDIAEIFKPIITDRLVLTLINKGMIKKHHFEEKLMAVTLNEQGKRAFVEEMKRKLSSTILHRKLKRNVSYQHLIRLELYKLEKHLIGEQKYVPFISSW